MGRKLLFYMFSLGVMLLLSGIHARADFIIEFADGRKVNVGHYVEEGQTIKIYTAHGAIGFRKADVKNITEINAAQSANMPLETMKGGFTSTKQQEAVPTSSKGQKAKTSPNKAAVGNSQKQEPKEHKLTEADIEQIDERYQEVNQRYKSLWEKHKQEIRSGASDEEVAENRRQLLELDEERIQMKKQVRQQADPEDLPVWAQEKVAQPE